MRIQSINLFPPFFGAMWVDSIHGANGYGTLMARPETPSEGFKYANSTAKVIEEYYSADIWTGSEYYISLIENPVKYTINMFPNQPVIMLALPIQTSISSLNGSYYHNLLSATAFKGLE